MWVYYTKGQFTHERHNPTACNTPLFSLGIQSNGAVHTYSARQYRAYRGHQMNLLLTVSMHNYKYCTKCGSILKNSNIFTKLN